MSDETRDHENRASDLSGGTSTGAGNVDKIREILFGAQMKDYERRFARLEERLLKEVNDAREENQRRFETLESFLRKELESLGARLQTEQGERSDAVKAASRALQDVNDSLERRLGQLGAQTTDAHRDIRQQILDQSNMLREEYRRKMDELAASLERALQELRSDKTDRSALAGLFAELAMRLNEEFTLGGD